VGETKENGKCDQRGGMDDYRGALNPAVNLLSTAAESSANNPWRNGLKCLIRDNKNKRLLPEKKEWRESGSDYKFCSD